MEMLTLDPNWVVCGLKQLIFIHQWRHCNFNSDSFRTKFENADDMWFHDRLFLWCRMLPGNIWHRRWECSRITVLNHCCPCSYYSTYCCIFILKDANYPDMFHGFVEGVFLDFLPNILLNPCKEGNPFNYCQDLVVRCNIPFLSAVSSSCMAAHGDSAPTLAAAEPALCQWPHPSVSLHFRDVQVASAHTGIHEAAPLTSSTIRVCLAEISLNTIGQIDKIILRSVKIRLKSNIGTITFKYVHKGKSQTGQDSELWTLLWTLQLD